MGKLKWILPTETSNKFVTAPLWSTSIPEPVTTRPFAFTAKFVSPAALNVLITSADCDVFPFITIPEVVVDGIWIFKAAFNKLVPIPTLPPTITDWPIPTPPDTTKAPVVVLVEAVLSVTPTNPDVVPVAEIFPENVFAVITFVAGLTVNPLSLETATPDPPLTGENNI